MENLAKQIDTALNAIILKSENHLELLVGSCESQMTLTNTQEHILMLVKEGKASNSDLAKALTISQAAVTKALKALKKEGLLEAVKDEYDGRMTYYRLTEQAKPIAREHAQHHEKTLKTYQELIEQFSEDEQALISRFLSQLLTKIEAKS